jgi:formate dehydrogenase-N alpha subunit
MTNSWNDIKNADVVIIMGGNAAEAHPCGFKWVTEAKANNAAKLIVVDPRFTRSASVSDLYAPLRPGTDIAFLSGVMRYLLANGKIHQEYVKAFTNASHIVKEGYGFQDGLFAGYDEARKNYVDRSSWDYEFDEQGMAKVDDTLQNPRCAINLLKAHVERYTPEMVERICGTPKDKFLKVCELIATTANGERSMTSLYALGWTQHTTGAQNIRAMAMIQLLLGNMGVPGGGVNALRGHSNVQGITDLALLSTSTPGYLVLPTEKETTYADYMKSRGFKPIRPGQTSFWQNYGKFFVSQQKSLFGQAATKDNDWAYDYLPKFDVSYDVLKMVDMMAGGQMNGLFCQGLNILMAAPNKAKVATGLAKLKWLVIIDPLETETAHFWENHGEFNNVDPKAIQTEVIQLPATAYAEEEGSATNSSRVIQWHWKAVDGPGESRGDIQIIAELQRRLRALYTKEGGAFPDPILNTAWSYANPDLPEPAELLKELNGYAVEDLPDPADPAKTMLKAGQLLPAFAVMRDDGKTSGGCWIYTGVYTEAGNMAMRRGRPDRSRHPSQLGLRLAGQPAHPLQSRLGRPRGQAVERAQEVHLVERHALDRRRRAGLRTDDRAGQVGRAVHHEPGRHGAAVCPHRHARRPVPRALRADGRLPRQSAASQGQQQSGGAGVRRRRQVVRHARQVPDRGDELPPGRALPLLDQERPRQCRPAAGDVRRNGRAVGQGQGHRQRRLGRDF